MAFDLDAIHGDALEEGEKCYLFMPDLMTPMIDDDGTQCWIQLVGRDSRRFQEVVRRRATEQSKRIFRAQMRGRNNSARMADELATTGDEQEENLMESRVACTVAWSGFSLGGPVMACTPENARRLYNIPKLRFIVDQVDEFIGERAHFLKLSNGTSSNGHGKSSPAAETSPPSRSITDRPSEPESA
jgi:hypothetical protein